MNLTKTTYLAAFAAIAVSMAATAQIYSTDPNSGGTANPDQPVKFGDISITQTKVGDVTPSFLVKYSPTVPETNLTGVAAGVALSLFALSRFINRRK